MQLKQPYFLSFDFEISKPNKMNIVVEAYLSYYLLLLMYLENLNSAILSL